jgi:LuxR family maltose regulon positive regulatory protein
MDMPADRSPWTPRVKLAPPRAPAAQIDRADLIGHPSTWRDAKLVLVHAAAGFGKTVLLSQIHAALASEGCLRIWMSLSDDERQADDFLALLLKAMRSSLGAPAYEFSAAPEISRGERQRSMLDAALRAFDALERDTWVFIDDLHHVDSRSVNEVLRRLLRLTNPNVRFVVASRAGVDLRVANLRAERQVREVTSEDLKFSRDQVQRLLETGLVDSELDQVLADTEGWPVAVRLIKSFFESGAGSYSELLAQGRPRREMFEYLSEQVLAGVPAEVEEFMLWTSIGQRINADLASAVLGREPAAAGSCLETALALHLPLGPCTDRPDWYQYHSLFAEFLRATAVARDPVRFKQAHADAAQWFAARQAWSEALHHAFRGGTLREILSALEAAGGVRMAMRYGHYILRPLANLEAHATRDFPLCRLGQIYFWALEGQIAGARAALEDLRENATWSATHQGGMTVGGARAPVDMLVVDFLVSLYEERPLSNADIARLESGLRELPATEAPLAAAGRGLVAVASFDAFQFDRCRSAIEGALLTYQQVNSPYSEAFMQVYSVLVELEQGRLMDARRCVDRLALHVRERLGSQDPLRRLPDLMRAQLAYESGDLEGAIDHLERSRTGFAVLHGWFNLQMQLLRASTLILLRARGLEAALALIEDIDARSVAMGQQKAALSCALHRANLLLRAGEWPAARTLVESERVSRLLSGPFEPRNPVAYLRIYAGELRAELDLIDDRASHAATRLRALVDFARGKDWTSALARLALLEAAALERTGDAAGAAAIASEGLDVARRTQQRSCIADRVELIGAPIERLLASRALVPDRVTLDYWRGIVGDPHSASDGGTARQLLRLRLSPRQMQVLELLSRGLSSKEIADRLGLGLGTVKAHRVSLYRKLGVRHRSEAFAALEQLRGPPGPQP